MNLVGIELENNDTTEMEQVVRLLMFVFGAPQSKAIESMIKVHQNAHACVATVLKDDIGVFTRRLDEFIAQMENPVAYRLVNTPPNRPDMIVDSSGLMTWQAFQENEAAKWRKTKLLYLGGALVFCAIIYIILR